MQKLAALTFECSPAIIVVLGDWRWGSKLYLHRKSDFVVPCSVETRAAVAAAVAVASRGSMYAHRLRPTSRPVQESLKLL